MKIPFHRLVQQGVTGARLFASGPLKCRKLGYSLLSGKQGLEIGGPSVVFRKSCYLPIYDKVLSLDNLDFKRDTQWASHKDSYCFHRSKPAGQMYFGEGSDLRGIPDHSYDFLLSSHNLEHMANPIKALKEWQRVVKPGGSLVIVLPHYLHTFDRKRTPTTLQHMLKDFERSTGEDDLSHFDEVYTPPAKPSKAADEIRELLWNNVANRMIHHHVFDEFNSRQLLESAGLKLLAAETYPPYHIFLIAQL